MSDREEIRFHGRKSLAVSGSRAKLKRSRVMVFKRKFVAGVRVGEKGKPETRVLASPDK